MKRTTKSQWVISAIAWATIISIILYIFGVREKWAFVVIYSILTSMALFGNMDKNI